MCRTAIALCVLVLSLSSVCVSEPQATRIRIIDSTGAPFPNVLVIIQSLDDRREIARYLTNSDGLVPPIQFGGGLYRIVLTCPYGLCKTSVYELLKTDIPASLTLTASVQPTDMNGRIVDAAKITILVVDNQDKPVPGAQVLIRDPEAKWNDWYTTSSDGKISVSLPFEPSTAVVLYQGKLWTVVVALKCASQTAQTCAAISESHNVVLRLK